MCRNGGLPWPKEYHVAIKIYNNVTTVLFQRRLHNWLLNKTYYSINEFFDDKGI